MTNYFDTPELLQYGYQGLQRTCVQRDLLTPRKYTAFMYQPMIIPLPAGANAEQVRHAYVYTHVHARSWSMPHASIKSTRC